MIKVQWTKDPESVLDYTFDWRALGCLDDEEVIHRYEITSVGVDILRHSEENGAVTIWVAGGNIRKRAIASCKIVTNAGRTYKRSMQFIIKNK